MDACLSSGANTFPHQCDRSILAALAALQASSQPLQQSHALLGCVPLKKTWHKSQRKKHKKPQKATTESKVQWTSMNFRNQQHIPSQVFCHSDLEGKCLCAHGRLSQLWCQHFSSSMRQINPSCLSCLTSLKPTTSTIPCFTWMCATQENITQKPRKKHKKPQKATTESKVPWTFMNFRNQQHIPSQVFCHSDLEGKCLCAHGRLSQLWCQHFSSSMRQINPSCLSCLTSL